MLADAMTSIKAYLYERAASPLLGSLIVSWCAWNYKFLLLWVSGMKFPEKLRYVHVLYSSDYEIYLQGIVFPFLTSMVYLFLFTYPAEWVYRFSLDRQKVLNDLKNDKQENELLTVEQSKAVRNQLSDTERQFDEQLERKDRAIEVRDREIEELRNQLAEKDKQVEDVKSQLEQPRVPESSKPAPKVRKKVSLQERVLELIKLGESDNPKTEDEYFAKALINIYKSGATMKGHLVLSLFPDKTKARYYMDELVTQGFVSYDSVDYSLPHQVKGVFVRND
ncbi:hypothetical protein [Vibrio echinoideorum]|uniref:hypothetical protein n=1 Tax=Vibrio echinoideorum TaxID=2100116 RepID=UPI0035545BE3